MVVANYPGRSGSVCGSVNFRNDWRRAVRELNSNGLTIATKMMARLYPRIYDSAYVVRRSQIDREPRACVKVRGRQRSENTLRSSAFLLLYLCTLRKRRPLASTVPRRIETADQRVLEAGGQIDLKVPILQSTNRGKNKDTNQLAPFNGGSDLLVAPEVGPLRLARPAVASEAPLKRARRLTNVQNLLVPTERVEGVRNTKKRHQ